MMVKIMFCLRRRQGLTVEAFRFYWSTQHAALVAEHAHRLGIRRYVQSQTLDDGRFSALAEQRGFAGEVFDGVAELWFDAAHVLYRDRPMPEPSLQAARDLLADEAQFIDLARSPIFVVEEREIILNAG